LAAPSEHFVQGICQPHLDSYFAHHG
jgi:hypothetical protein